MTLPRGEEAARRWWQKAIGVAWWAWIVVLCLTSLVAGWVRFGLLDADRYVATVREMSRDDVILDDVRLTIVRSVDAAVDPARSLRAALPVPIEGLAAVGAELAREVLDEVVGRVLRSQFFEEAWARAARSAHAQLVDLLTGDGEAITSVVLDLSPILSAVGEGLRALGVDLAEQISDRLFLRYELVGTDSLEATRDVVRVLEVLALWLPPVTLLSAVGGLAASRSRRRALRSLGSGVFVAGLAALALASWARSGYLDGRPTDALAAAGRVFDIFTDAPREIAAVFVVAGLAVVVGASPRLARTWARLAPSRFNPRSRPALAGRP